MRLISRLAYLFDEMPHRDSERIVWSYISALVVITVAVTLYPFAFVLSWAFVVSIVSGNALFPLKLVGIFWSIVAPFAIATLITSLSFMLTRPDDGYRFQIPDPFREETPGR